MRDELIMKLMNNSSLDSFLTMYFGLSKKDRLSVLGDEILIPKDFIFYRARKEESKPLINEEDWWMAPKQYVGKGRFNYAHKPVLYLGTMDYVLPRELGLKVGESYYLAKYRVKKSFYVGSFMKTFDIVNGVLHKIAMAIENDTKLTDEELRVLKYDSSSLNPWDAYRDINSIFYLNHFIKRDLYDITNKLSDLMLERNSNGIRYSSCYMPIEVSGSSEVLTFNGELEGNYAFTQEGISNLEWIASDRHIYTDDDSKKNDLSLFISIEK